MAESLIPLARAWNSWDPVYPAEMRFLPAGVSVMPCAYAASRNAFTRFPPGGQVRLGRRAVDASLIELELEHAGTRLRMTYSKPEPFSIRGAWQTVEHGEWGLRFWLVLCFRLDPPSAAGRPTSWSFDPQTGLLTARVGPMHVAVAGERPPLLATFHEDIEALQREYEEKGYFCLDSRGTAGAFAALRYNLEEMPGFAFAIALAHDAAAAAQAARDALDAPTGRPAALQTGRFAGSLDAVRDVIGWNTVWDPANRRPYTALSRSWVAQKFGGWGVWLDDVLYHALLASAFDAEIARENLQAALAQATPDGNLPCLVTGRDGWIDRSQPPIGGFILWMLHLRSGSRDLLRLAFEPLLRNHEWWWRRRDGNGDGLLEYGTSPLGDGLYRGTKLAAKDESSMDNSPVHDEATLDPGAGTLDCADVGLNSLVALDGEMLALAAQALGEAETSERLTRRSEALRRRIMDRLWDEERGVFANRLWNGRFVRSLAPTSFFPLLAGAAAPHQAKAMLRLLDDPAKFGGTWRLPAVTRDDPAFRDNVYWRGRIWPPLNFLVYHALRRQGFDAAASRLAENGLRLFMGAWRDRLCPENFNAVTGEACDQPDTDGFYGWGALLPLLGAAEVSDVTPWHGWEIAHGGDDLRLGPFLAPAGTATIAVAGGELTLSLQGRPALRSRLPGRYRRLRFSPEFIGLELPEVPEGAAYAVEFPAVPAGRVSYARLADREIAIEPAGEGLRVRIPSPGPRRRLRLFLDGPTEGAP